MKTTILSYVTKRAQHFFKKLLCPVLTTFRNLFCSLESLRVFCDNSELCQSLELLSVYGIVFEYLVFTFQPKNASGIILLSIWYKKLFTILILAGKYQIAGAWNYFDVFFMLIRMNLKETKILYNISSSDTSDKKEKKYTTSCKSTRIKTKEKTLLVNYLSRATINNFIPFAFYELSLD